MTNHYETLGVERGASEEVIREAARRAASRAHPDREGGSHERMQAVNQARDVLLDPERRARYDAGEGDAPRLNVDARARDVLAQTFAAAIDSDQEPVHAARGALADAKRQIDANLASVFGRIASLKRRQGTVKVKNGAENHVEDLIAQRLANLDREVARLNESAAVHARAVHARVVQLLEDYEGPPPPPPSPLEGIFAGQYGNWAPHPVTGGPR